MDIMKADQPMNWVILFEGSGMVNSFLLLIF